MSASDERIEFRAASVLSPLLIAPLGAAAVYMVALVPTETDLATALLVGGLVGLYSLLAGLILVLPVLLLVPRLRRPPLWLAAMWGLLVAWLAIAILLGLWWSPVWWLYGAMGAASGLAYAIAARRFQ